MRALILIGALTGLTLLAGCAGVATTADENHRRTVQIMEYDGRQMTDDWNLMWLADRPYRLTKYHSR
ncbi:MAG: hypothetical protein AB7Q17_09010 [Phycisphaerae bacterium]